MKVRELIEQLKDMPDWMDVVVAFSDGEETEAIRVREFGGQVGIETSVKLNTWSDSCLHCGC